MRGALGTLVLAVVVGCAGPTASPSPTLSADDARAVERADAEAARLLGTDARLVLRQSNATLRMIYGGGGGLDRGFDDAGLFVVYASPRGGLFAEMFVRYEDVKVTFSRTTTDPVRR